MRPSLALCMIMRDEVHNLPRLFASIKGCFDEIHITDTGSKDGSCEWVQKHGCEFAGAPVFLHHFEWVNDFARARNYSFSHANTDYIGWLDLDDELHNPEGFKQWRDHAMQFADGWYANYHYAVDQDKKPVITFIRERVVKNDGNFKWQFFVHEGLIGTGQRTMQIAHAWSVNHLRSQEDFDKDRSRNLKLLEENKDSLPSRLLFYYGKELFDNMKPDEAIKVLLDSVVKTDLEHHDRVLALQYACYAAMQLADQLKPEFQGEKYLLAEKLAKQGLELAPLRAEFHCILGDAYVRRNQLLQAVPHFSAAEACLRSNDLNISMADPIFHFKDCYEIYPKTQRAKIYYHLGLLDRAEALTHELVAKNAPESAQMLSDINKHKKFTDVSIEGREQTNDIVFTCQPNSAYPFDELIYQSKPLGGSETALVEMAMNLWPIAKSKVIVFNDRDHSFTGPSGVEWRPVKEIPEYFCKYLPKAHIAWRHNIRLTAAPTYLWHHDLKTGGTESNRNFDKILCLSEFHKNYLMGMDAIPAEQIILTRNGLTPSKFEFTPKPKDPNKIVYMSSPDRGLDKSILVVEKMRETNPNLELHVYYGIENLYKYGMKDLADKLKAMMDARPWVKYHGFTEQKKMYYEVSDAVLWCHPASFIETFCITALEMLALGIYPVTRRLGALQNTLADAEQHGQATLLDGTDVDEYATECLRVLDAKLWEGVNLDLVKHSWESIAQEWASFMSIV